MCNLCAFIWQVASGLRLVVTMTQLAISLPRRRLSPKGRACDTDLPEREEQNFISLVVRHCSRRSESGQSDNVRLSDGDLSISATFLNGQILLTISGK